MDTSKVKCVYRAVVYDENKREYLCDVLNKNGGVSLGEAVYYLVKDVSRRMHLELTLNEQLEAGDKILKDIIWKK
jgi:hypothetical protein